MRGILLGHPSTKSGIPVHSALSHLKTASTWYRFPLHIIVGDNFNSLTNEEKEFILLHEEGHLTYGLVPPGESCDKELEIEHNCDLYALERSNLDAAIGAMDKMIANSIKLKFTTKIKN